MIQVVFDEITIDITKDNLCKLFNTNQEGVNPYVYKEDDCVESLKLMIRPSYKHHRKELKKWMLRRKFRFLMTVLTKYSLGEQQSHNGLYLGLECCMRAILDGVQDDWAGVLLRRLKEESGRF